jgi:HEPN domain-containing protein
LTPKPSGKTRAEPRHKAAIFWQKADRFSNAAAMNAENEDWDPAVANAVNSVINLTDAVCVHYVGLRSAGDSLLDMKGIAQYEGRLLDKNDADKALKAMGRAFEAVKPICCR